MEIWWPGVYLGIGLSACLIAWLSFDERLPGWAFVTTLLGWPMWLAIGLFALCGMVMTAEVPTPAELKQRREEARARRGRPSEVTPAARRRSG